MMFSLLLFRERTYLNDINKDRIYREEKKERARDPENDDFMSVWEVKRMIYM